MEASESVTFAAVTSRPYFVFVEQTDELLVIREWRTVP